MLPWLFISGLKSVLLTFLETLTGVYVCSAFGKVRKPCIEFVISKAIELFFAIYLWACIRSIHKDFERFEEHYREEELLTKMVVHRVNLRRRRARSMIDESTLQKTSNLNYFGLKDVPNIIFDMLKTEDELSQDSLLSPGMMLTSVSNMGSYDYLKTSLSLGELGIIDLNSFQVSGLDDCRYLSLSERAMNFLKLTREDIREAKERTKSKTFAENYKITMDVLRSLTEMKPSNVLNRVPRPNEVYSARLPELDKVKEYLNMKIKRQKFQEDLFIDNSYFNIYSRDETERFVGLEEDDGFDEEEEEKKEEEDSESISMTGEAEDQITPKLWFMTNIKDQVDQFRLVEPDNSKRSCNYERLYRQDFMSNIGKEVFDRANKLVKLTSLSDVTSRKDNLENKPELGSPCTSQDVDLKSPESVEEDVATPKPIKTKKLAFEGHFDSSTTMPLSVIVTNLPLQLDSDIRTCEATYFRGTMTNSAKLPLLSKRAMEPYLEIYDEESTSSEMEEKISHNSTSPVLTAAEEAHLNKRTKIRETFNEENGSKNAGKANLLTLKCSRATNPDYLYGQCSRQHETKWLSRGLTLNRSLAIFERDDQDLALMRPHLMMDKTTCCYDRIYPRTSEQMMFIRDMMRRPLSDVLKYYYNLREAEGGNSGMKRISSTDSVRFENGLTMRPVSRFDIVKNDLSHERIGNAVSSNSSVQLSKLEKKSFTDREIQVSFGEDSLTETITLGTTATINKLERSNSDFLPPLYLFGNNDLILSSSPRDVSLDEPHNELYSNGKFYLKSGGTTEESITSSHSISDGLTESGIMALPNVSTSSHASYKVALQCSQRNKLGKDSFSSAQDQISTEVISLSDDNPSICSAESDESFSLFYSKTADLASPRLDMRRFIYLDHIHYSYKNVKKKGFDVELNGGLPLLVRDSLALDPSRNIKGIETPPDPQTGITRRPMDLTFANMDTFSKHGEKQSEPGSSYLGNNERSELSLFEMTELLADSSEELNIHSEIKKNEQNWLGKLLTEDVEQNPDDYDRELLDTSSMNLHSNKDRVGIISNPAVILQSNKIKKKLRRSRINNGPGNF